MAFGHRGGVSFLKWRAFRGNSPRSAS